MVHGFIRSFGMRLEVFYYTRRKSLLKTNFEKCTTQPQPHLNQPPTPPQTETKERIEWVKPIMFSAGIGQMDSRHTKKGAPEDGHLVVKIGGPAYRIGMGGGAASSRVNDAATAALDFNAVQVIPI